MTNVVEMSGVVKRFGTLTALDGLDLTVAEGEVHGFLGPNGAGKTTTLRLLLGMLRSDGGSSRVLGMDPWGNVATLHRRLAYVPGDVALWPNLTGGEVIDLLGRLQGGHDQARRGYGTEQAGAAILPAPIMMILVAPRSAKMVEARGSRPTLMAGYAFVALGFLVMLLLWHGGSAYWAVGLGYALLGTGVGLAATPAARSLTGSVPPPPGWGWPRARQTCNVTLVEHSCSRSWGRCSRPDMRPRSAPRSPPLPTRTRSRRRRSRS